NWRPPAPEITPEPPTRDDDADEDSEDGSQLTLPLFAAPPQTEPAPPRRPAIGPQEVLEIVGALDRILTAGEKSRFRRGTIGRWRKPLERLFDQAAELRSLLVPANRDDPNPLEEDWEWARVDVLALLELVNQFTDAFTSARRAAAVVDFADLEQLALRLLWDPAAQAPTALARQWRERLDLVF